MITGGHMIFYRMDSERDRGFFTKILEIPNLDIAKGWIISGLPSSELAFRSSSENGMHRLSLICDDLNLFLKKMDEQKWRALRLKISDGDCLPISSCQVVENLGSIRQIMSDRKMQKSKKQPTVWYP
jgi:hypothetical protein